MWTSSGPNESVKEPFEAVTVRVPSSDVSARLASAGTLIVEVTGLRVPFTAIT